jgi:hypothetical protein
MKRKPMSEGTKEKLRAAYRMRAAARPENFTVGKKEPVETEAVIVKVCVNPRLVEAGGDGVSRVLVDVGRNHNFAVGDVVVVRAHPEMSDVCEFVRMGDAGLAVDHVGLPRDKRRVYR